MENELNIKVDFSYNLPEFSGVAPVIGSSVIYYDTDGTKNAAIVLTENINPNLIVFKYPTPAFLDSIPHRSNANEDEPFWDFS